MAAILSGGRWVKILSKRYSMTRYDINTKYAAPSEVTCDFTTSYRSRIYHICLTAQVVNFQLISGVTFQASHASTYWYYCNLSTTKHKKTVCTCLEYSVLPCWRHQMEKLSVLLTLCEGNSPVIGEFPSQRQVTQSFDVFFDLLLNKRMRKQSWGWWFETPLRPLWRRCNSVWRNGIHEHQYFVEIFFTRDRSIRFWPVASTPRWILFDDLNASWNQWELETAH